MKPPRTRSPHLTQDTAPQNRPEVVVPFRHQSYTTEPPRAPYFFLRPSSACQFGTQSFRERMRAVGDGLRSARVSAVYLVHSSFAAFDAQAILLTLARRYSPAAPALKRLAAQLVDAEVPDAGNFTDRYTETLQTALGDDRPAVRLFSWSCENHHLGRADAAVRLIAELAGLQSQPGERVLLWGHGHAGNVFALMSQLLSSDALVVEQFFEAAGVFYRWPWTSLVDVPVWRRVRQLLSGDRHNLVERPCDFVTFGTPLRYGWQLRPDDHLLHFIHHRPDVNRPAYLAPIPSHIDEALHGQSGDYLQQVAIAGTDTPPPPVAWRSWLANRRLHQLLNRSHADSLPGLLEAGARVPDCGTTLLVDYGASPGTPAEHLAGHAVYTRPEWLLFHAERIIQHFYAKAMDRAQAA